MNFIEYLKENLALDEQLIDYIAGAFEQKAYAKDERWIHSGQRSEHLAYIAKGSAVTIENNDGEDFVLDFFIEKDWMAVLDEDSISKVDMLFIEDSVVYQINRSEIESMTFKIPMLQDKIQKIHQTYMRKYTDRIRCLLAGKIEQRYRILLNDHPNYLQRFPQYYVASYLGAKPESLSRIKGKIM